MLDGLVNNVEELTRKMADATEVERHLALVKLLEDGVIKFPDLSRMYIQVLEKDNAQKTGDIMTLALWVAALNSNDEESVFRRRWLWERGYFRGSPYGDALDREFASK